MKRLLVGALLFWPPAHCGGEKHYPLKREPETNNLFHDGPLRRSPGATDLNEMAALRAEIEILKAELAEAKAEVTPEDAKTKRTDIKKLMGDQADSTVDKLSTTEGLDMVQTCVTVDGSPIEMRCDAPGCTEIAHNVWFSVDTGILFKRCDKHKDGVVIK
jgi:hypothetical protein